MSRSMQRGGGLGERLADAGQPDRLGHRGVVEADDGAVAVRRPGGAQGAERERVAGADERGGRPASRAGPGRAAAPVVDAVLVRAVEAGRAEPHASSARTQPARRSSPTPEPAGQPRKPIRRWPASTRWRVACGGARGAVDVDPRSACPARPTAGRRSRTARRARPARRCGRRRGGCWSARRRRGRTREQVVVGGDLVAGRRRRCRA